jgi:hypothetical protein
MSNTPQNYGSRYHTYPVFSVDGGYEGALKQFSPMPTPRDVFDYALMGLPKFFPLTKEPITPDLFKPFLESAITEIQMSMNMDLTPTEHFQSFDYVDGSFESNWSGFKLQQWPATSVTQMQLKFPHTQTTTTFQTYTIPPVWVMLRRNRINVSASYGAVSIQANSTQNASAAGIFSYITGFTRGVYQPGIIEVQYQSGWANDQLPSNVADLVKTWAAWRSLPDLFASLFPVSGTSVGIDSVSQSATIPMAQMLQLRYKMLDDKRKQLQNSITGGLGRTIKMGFIGAGG